MVSRAIHKYAKVSPKKVELVLDLIRGHEVEKAFANLSSLRKRLLLNY